MSRSPHNDRPNGRIVNQSSPNLPVPTGEVPAIFGGEPVDVVIERVRSLRFALISVATVGALVVFGSGPVRNASAIVFAGLSWIMLGHASRFAKRRSRGRPRGVFVIRARWRLPRGELATRRWSRLRRSPQASKHGHR